MPESVKDNPSEQRYEMTVDGQLAFAEYADQGHMRAILHVETPEALRGHGVAARLMEGILLHVRARGLTLKPVCSYAVAWMEKHGKDRQ